MESEAAIFRSQTQNPNAQSHTVPQNKNLAIPGPGLNFDTPTPLINHLSHPVL